MLLPCLDSDGGNDAHILTNMHIHTHAACLPKKSDSVPLLANYCLHMCYQMSLCAGSKNLCLKRFKWQVIEILESVFPLDSLKKRK